MAGLIKSLNITDAILSGFTVLLSSVHVYMHVHACTCMYMHVHEHEHCGTRQCATTDGTVSAWLGLISAVQHKQFRHHMTIGLCFTSSCGFLSNRRNLGHDMRFDCSPYLQPDAIIYTVCKYTHIIQCMYRVIQNFAIHAHVHVHVQCTSRTA